MKRDATEERSEIMRIPREQHIWSFDSTAAPVARIRPGETCVFETHDARGGTIRSESDSLEVPPKRGFNPATGPVYVEGTRPGDVLAVKIERIELGEQGFTGVKIGTGLLGDQAKIPVTRIVRVEGAEVIFKEGIRFPVRPMVGTIGVAPAGEGVGCMYPGRHGGNMDNNLVTTGATVRFPVFVEGALLALGDVHASMGDGEISIVGLDVPAVVTVSVNVEEGAGTERPWIETGAGDWVTTGDDVDAATAMRLAAREMVAHLGRRLGMTFEDAYMLATIRGDLGICQAADPGRFPVTTRFVMPACVVGERT